MYLSFSITLFCRDYKALSGEVRINDDTSNESVPIFMGHFTGEYENVYILYKHGVNGNQLCHDCLVS